MSDSFRNLVEEWLRDQTSLTPEEIADRAVAMEAEMIAVRDADVEV